MNNIDYGYKWEQTTVDDRDIALQRMLYNLDEMEEMQAEQARIDAITKETGYWFEGIQYD